MSQLKLKIEAVRQKLQAFEFRGLFVEDLGWSLPPEKATVAFPVGDTTFERVPIAAVGGVIVFEIRSPGGQIPATERDRKRVLEAVTKEHHENLLIFVDGERQQSVWVWGKRDGTKLLPREHYYQRSQPGDLFLPKLAELYVDFEELDSEGKLEVAKAGERLKAALDVERVTKKFFVEYEKLHLEFLGLIEGLEDAKDRRWYASILLNRLMFIYFLQEKQFLDHDYNYLRSRFEFTRKLGEDRYFQDFLRPLFFEGFAKPTSERSPETQALLGDVRYLNGGLFLQHRIELNNPEIRIPDRAFENLLHLFESYSWHLDDTPGGQDNEINPDVLGYIFEKYINQKAFGAYYTRPEITEYLCEQTLHRLILDRVNALPGNDERFESIGDLLLKMDARLCRSLKDEILPKLSILDPACGSGAFLVAALKTLIYVYSGVTGRIPYLKDKSLKEWYDRTHREHPSLLYFVKREIITNNLFGVDIMEEAAEIAKLRLFLALVSSVDKVEELEPLPNIDFNILTGNSLIGLLHVNSAAFAAKNGQGDMFSQAEYQERLAEKNRWISAYRQGGRLYGDALRGLRDDIETARNKALPILDGVLLEQFKSHGIKFEQATWDLKKNQEGKPEKRSLEIADVRVLQPFHWGYEFDQVIADGGFDAILTNPPWEAWKPQAKEFFAEHSDLVTKNKMAIKDFEKEQAKLLKNPELRGAWIEYLSRFPHQSLYYRSAPQYKNQIAMVKDASGKEKKAGTDVNLYKLFLEQAFNLLRPGGRCGILVPTGLYTDLGAKQLREMLFSEGRVQSLFGLSNEKFLFEGVHHSFRICLLTFEKGGETTEFQAAFRINPREAVSVGKLRSFLRDKREQLSLSTAMIRRMSPDSLSVIEFRSDKDIAIAEKMALFPLLGDRIEGAWNLSLTNEFHMTNDSFLFQAAPGAGRLPMYEGKMIHQFDPSHAKPRYWISETAARRAVLGKRADEGQLLDYQRPRLALRRIARSSDERTLIAVVLPPRVFASESFHVVADLQPPLAEQLVLAVFLNSLVLDSLIRQRVSANLNLFHIAPLPVPRFDPSASPYAGLLRRSARLTCTSAPYRELWELTQGEPWSEARAATSELERAELRAELDALVAHIYGLTEEELLHVLAGFPLVSREVKDAIVTSYRVAAPRTVDQELRGLLLGGEGPRVEYKSTARWDLKRNEKSGDLERVVLKTIAGFLNAQGGTLLLGVGDDGKAVGLHHDYQTLQKRDRDGFGLLLGDLVFGTFGKDLGPCVQWHFHTLEDHDVCRVEIAPSPKLVFLRENNDDIFYLRLNNATKKLTGKELLEYEKTRWGSKGTPPTFEVREGPPSMALGPARGGDKGVTASLALAMSPLFKGQPVKASSEPNPPAAKKAAEPAEKDDDPEPRRSIDELDRNQSLCVIRDLFGTADARDGLAREDALRQLANALGFDRLGARIREELDNDIRTAVTRKILRSESGQLLLGTRSIEDYDREELKSQLIAGVGAVWTERDEATRIAARRLGFARTGKRIQEAFSSAINGALRQGRLEAAGNTIRKAR